MDGTKKPSAIPSLKSDEEAERFVENADLSEYDLLDMKPLRFEFGRASE